MKEQRIPKAAPSTSVWERLEEFARGHIQRFIQALMEEEVTELLGREIDCLHTRPLVLDVTCIRPTYPPEERS